MSNLEIETETETGISLKIETETEIFFEILGHLLYFTLSLWFLPFSTWDRIKYGSWDG